MPLNLHCRLLKEGILSFITAWNGTQFYWWELIFRNILWPMIRDWLLSPVAKKDNYGRRAGGGCRGLAQYTIKMTLPRHEGVWKSRDVNPRIINFKIRCR